jgi:CDGSH-type Zn-finger protein
MVNTVRIRESGPLAFHAEMRVAGATALRATLCRCGASSSKPWCDSSHHTSGFAASGEPEPSVSVRPASRRDGPLSITGIENGPLIAAGALEIVSGTGRTLAKAGEVDLCRCGHSGNKPFCDGSHARAGFKAAAF